MSNGNCYFYEIVIYTTLDCDSSTAVNLISCSVIDVILICVFNIYTNKINTNSLYLVIPTYSPNLLPLFICKYQSISPFFISISNCFVYPVSSSVYSYRRSSNRLYMKSLVTQSILFLTSKWHNHVMT